MRAQLRHRIDAENSEDAIQRSEVGGFIEGDAERAVGEFAEKHARLRGASGQVGRESSRRRDTQGVEESVVVHGVSGFA